MKQMKRVAIGSTVAVLVLLGALIFRPVPIVAESECDVVTGRVIKIFEGGPQDVCIYLDSTRTRYYINRGLDQGLDLDELRRDLMGREVTLKYPRYWTPLDPTNSMRHVSKVEFGETVVFDETVQEG